MATSETKWFCDTCNEKYNSKEDAEDCEHKHYKFKEIASISYAKGVRCPQFIVCDINIGDDIKQVTFIASQEGWGKK